ncbi:MAG: V4R domain-containing protein [Thermoplasmata archaeon]
MTKREQVAEKLQFDMGEGELSFNGVRYILIRPETIVRFQKEVEKAMGERTSAAMSLGGYEGGSLSTKAYMERFDLSNKEVAEFMCNMGSQLGWGRFELVELGERVVIEVHNSPFAEEYGSSESAICHMIEGVMAGMGSTVLGSNVRSIEEKCKAKGDRVCRFVIEKVE